MDGVPSHAKVVIIGAGIVGNCVAYHLAQNSWKDLATNRQGAAAQPGRLYGACL